MNQIATGFLLGCFAIWMGGAMPANGAGANPGNVPAPKANPQPKSGNLFVQPAAGQIEFHNDSDKLLRIKVAGRKPFNLLPAEKKLQPVPQAGANPPAVIMEVKGNDGIWRRPFQGVMGAHGVQWKLSIRADFKDGK